MGIYTLFCRSAQILEFEGNHNGRTFKHRKFHLNSRQYKFNSLSQLSQNISLQKVIGNTTIIVWGKDNYVHWNSRSWGHNNYSSDYLPLVKMGFQFNVCYVSLGIIIIRRRLPLFTMYYIVLRAWPRSQRAPEHQVLLWTSDLVLCIETLGVTAGTWNCTKGMSYGKGLWWQQLRHIYSSIEQKLWLSINSFTDYHFYTRNHWWFMRTSSTFTI